MRVRVGDIVIALAIAAAGVLLLIGFSPRGMTPQLLIVRQDNVEIKRFHLDALAQPERFEIEAPYHLVIEAEQGRARFLTADCPDKVCVHTGWLTRPGQAAACVPSGVLIQLTGEAEDDLDVIIR